MIHQAVFVIFDLEWFWQAATNHTVLSIGALYQQTTHFCVFFLKNLWNNTFHCSFSRKFLEICQFWNCIYTLAGNSPYVTNNTINNNWHDCVGSPHQEKCFLKTTTGMLFNSALNIINETTSYQPIRDGQSWFGLLKAFIVLIHV